ncbi:MAG TPA: hypothetical protein PLF21_03300 [Exilispira sp.]|nr:hypothetical protein [Exilispira sp.]
MFIVIILLFILPASRQPHRYITFFIYFSVVLRPEPFVVIVENTGLP